MASSKTQNRLKETVQTGSEINAIIFSKILPVALYDFLGLLENVLRMLALVISYLNQARVYTEEYLSSDSHLMTGERMTKEKQMFSQILESQ